MRGLIKLAVVGAALSVFQVDAGVVVSEARAQSPGWCQGLTSRYFRAVSRARAKNCNIRTAVPTGVYYRRCLGNNPGRTLSNVQRWEQYARTCGGGGQGGFGQQAYCRNAASAITNEVRRARNRGCRTNTAWSYNRYYNWCLRSSRQAVSNQLRRWANYARTCRATGGGTGFCPRIYRPVCALWNGQRRTYNNACLANRAGARIIGQGQCTTAGGGSAQFCQFQAQRYTRSVNIARNRGCRINTAWSYNRFYNWCLRSSRGAAINSANRWANYARTCRGTGGGVGCPTIYRPVCAVQNGQRRTYSNSCVANRAGARIIGQGQCQVGGGNNRAQYCSGQANRYSGAINRARNKGCNLGNAWSRGRFYNWCMGQRNNASVAQSLNRWINYARTCRRQGGGNQGGGNNQAALRQACNAYANTTMGLIAQWRAKGCPTGSTRWSPNRAAHFSYCMASGVGNAAQQTRARRAELQQGCFRN